MARQNKKLGFSLVEVLIAVGLVAVVLSMIGGAIALLDRKVANERLIPFPRSIVPTGSEANLATYAYPQQDVDNNGVGEDPFRPNFVLAPSQVAETQAQALWRQVQDMYSASYAVTMVDGYVVHNFIRRSGGAPSPTFVGLGGFLSSPGLGDPLTDKQLKNPATLAAELTTRFPTTFSLWTPPAAVDASSYRAATFFFLGEGDRILGILRARAYDFTGAAVPYRFYEVSLARMVWKDTETTTIMENWVLDGTQQNFIEDISYRFVEDKKYPQNLIFPLTKIQADAVQGGTETAAPRNSLARLASMGEDYNVAGDWDTNTNPGVSRQQVSLVDGTAATRTPTDEWHVILPDPSLAQGEERARLVRQNGGGYPLPSPSPKLDQYNAIRRQGRFACVFKVFP